MLSGNYLKPERFSIYCSQLAYWRCWFERKHSSLGNVWDIVDSFIVVHCYGVDITKTNHCFWFEVKTIELDQRSITIIEENTLTLHMQYAILVLQCVPRNCLLCFADILGGNYRLLSAYKDFLLHAWHSELTHSLPSCSEVGSFI